MTTYLVTGCAGFISTTFVHYMLKRYTNIRIINLDALTYAVNLENLKDLEDDPRHIFIHGNICDEGAHRLPVETIEENYEIKSMDLVQFIFDVCGWNKKESYRAAGMEIAEENTIQFDLSTALEISAGRFIKR